MKAKKETKPPVVPQISAEVYGTAENSLDQPQESALQMVSSTTTTTTLLLSKQYEHRQMMMMRTNEFQPHHEAATT